MAVHFAGDLHLGHKSICKYRSHFSTSEEHDAAIIESIMRASGKREVLWLLGDCFFTKDSLSALRLFSANFMQVNWVLGNHDSDSTERQQNVFTAVQEGLVNKVGSLFKYKEFWLSHAPTHPAELRGKINIHGHVHSNSIPDSRYINVSLENIDYKPITLDEIRNLSLLYR